MRCKELLGVDLSQPGVLKQAKAAGLFETKCPLFVEGPFRCSRRWVIPASPLPAESR